MIKFAWTHRWRKKDSNLWFRISGQCFFDASEPKTGWEPRPVLMTDNGSFTVSRARLARVAKPPEGANARLAAWGLNTLPGPLTETNRPRRGGVAVPRVQFGLLSPSR